MDSYLRCCLLMLCISFAAPVVSGTYVSAGLGFGVAPVEVDTFDRLGTRIFAASDNEDTLALTLRAGWDRDPHRLGLAGRALPYDNALLSLMGVSYERVFGDGDLRPFVGVTAGVAGFIWLDNAHVAGFPEPAEVQGEYVFDAALGLRVGGRQQLSDRLALEVGLKGVATELETDIAIQYPTANGFVDGGRLTHRVRGFLVSELILSYTF